jgi:hypothetical protein
MARRRRWSLEGARALLPDVRARTALAVERVEGLLEGRERSAAQTTTTEPLDPRVEQVTTDWARAMEALGLEVKGLWLVDFDNGSGYYCWRWPETELAFYHGYDEGFEGRVRIQ